MEWWRFGCGGRCGWCWWSRKDGSGMKVAAGDGWCWPRSRVADGTPRSGGFISQPAAPVVGKRPKVEVALLLLPLLVVSDLAQGDDRSEASAPAEAPPPPPGENPKPAALPRSCWWCWSGGSISPGAAMIQLRNVCSWPAAAAASPSMASQPSSPTSPTSSVPGMGGKSPPTHSSFLAPPPPPPPPCSPGAAHLVDSAAAALLSEIAATPEDESPAAPPRDDDSVDVE
nr:unnamed protein product [Digitaria exilis]